MNRIFNLVWSNLKQRWIVVSEKVKGNGKVPSSPLRSIAVLAAMFAVGRCVSPTISFAADIVNPGFEVGNTSGWTTNGGLWSGGWPIDPLSYTGTPTLVSLQSGNGVDAITGTSLVFNGNYSLKLNDAVGGRDVSVLRAYS